MCLRHTGLRFFNIYHSAELNKITEAVMLMNPYDDRRVSMRRTHANGDLDIVRASYILIGRHMLPRQNRQQVRINLEIPFLV